MSLMRATLAMDFDAALQAVMDELKRQGFGVLSQIDVRAALKEKLGVDIPSYRILGACNPPLAHKAISADPDIGRLLPCNVLVREETPGRVAVVFADPQQMTAGMDKAEILEVANEARQRLEQVRLALDGRQ
jgi:uncharacterized protein (DUF302 family)